jgi:hypothetical protein
MAGTFSRSPFTLNPVSGLTTPCTPRIQSHDPSETWANDGLSIDQSGTIHDHVQNWRETRKKTQPIKYQLISLSLDQSYEVLQRYIRVTRRLGLTCLFAQQVPVYPYILAESSSLAWPIVPLQLNLAVCS